MPNRIIRDSIRTSRSLSELKDFDFRLWIHLLTYVDDFGRGSSDPEILKGFLFPRRRGTTEANIEEALKNLEKAKLISIYSVRGERYLYFPTWEQHQKRRAEVSKFPSPPLPENDSTCEQMQAIKSKPPPTKPTARKAEPKPQRSKSSENASNRNSATPTFLEVADYFKGEACFSVDGVNAANEAAKFIAYNAARGWDCLPDWKAAAELWATRADKHN